MIFPAFVQMFGFYGHSSKQHSDHIMQSFNGSGGNCASSCGSHLPVDLTISPHQFRQGVVLIPSGIPSQQTAVYQNFVECYFGVSISIKCWVDNY